MGPRKLLCWLLSGAVFYATIAASQTISGFQQQSFAEALKSKGVDGTNKEAVRKALSSKDEQTRGLAALRLSEMNDSAAVPDLERSLASEQSSEAALRIATALARFHSLNAELALEKSCSREDAGAGVVVAATDALRVYGMGDVPTYCVPTLMRIVNAPDRYRPADRANALDTLIGVTSVSADIRQAEITSAISLLNDPSSIVRASAVRLLAQAPTRETTALLVRAGEVEKNAAVRGLIQDSLLKAE